MATVHACCIPMQQLLLQLTLLTVVLPISLSAQSPNNAIAPADMPEYRRILQTLQQGSTEQKRALLPGLPQLPRTWQAPLLLRLLNDSSEKVQIAALETARRRPMEPRLYSRIEVLARHPDNIVVREQALMTLLEWDRSSIAGLPTLRTIQQVGMESDTAAAIRPDRSLPRQPVSLEDPFVAAFEQSVRNYQQQQPSPLTDRNIRHDELPNILRLPDESQPAELLPNEDPPETHEDREPPQALFPNGFTGPSGIQPTETQQSPHFEPVVDRWRLGFPEWNRLQAPDDPQDNYPYAKGHWWDPYNQNVLKGDYPIIGDHTFLNITASSQMLHEFRQVPTPTTPFESTVNPFQEEFFGDPDQYLYSHFLSFSVDLFHGSTAFKPFDWRLRMTPVLNANYLDTNELGIVQPDVRAGTTRFRDDITIEEWFFETKLADIGPDYDFISVRAGSQPIVTDFRGFILADTNRAVRLFGTAHQNREQFNIWWIDQLEKNLNNQLNTFSVRPQNTLVVNYFRQDTFVPGYTLQASFHYNNDRPSVKFDDNGFLARPDPTGIYQPHEINAYYFGLAGDGHLGILNVSHAFYHVEGRDSNNPLGGEPARINANMFAAELSVDRDWIRFRTSYFWASGDDDPNDGKAEGFDTILDNPNFAGGEFSYWNRQEVRLLGAGLSQRFSLVPNLRSNKLQGQSNFVNPGLHLVNLGMDFEITPKTTAIGNLNWLWFDETAVLEQFVFQDNIDEEIGIDLSLGIEYRPFLNDNVQIIGGASMLIPGRGFRDLYGVTDPFVTGGAQHSDVDNLYAGFIDVILTY